MKRKLQIEKAAPRLFNIIRAKDGRTAGRFDVQYEYNMFLTLNIKYNKHC
jgi:hypothetical protein